MDSFLHHFFVQLEDIPVILTIIAGVLLPELIQGFSRKATLGRLGILTVCCVLSTVCAYYWQQADPGGAFTRAFLIGITARINLVMNHATEAALEKQKEAE